MKTLPASSRRTSRLLGLTAALACTGPLLCGAASAQSAVTVYGTVDMSIGRLQNSGTPDTKVVDSGKRTTSYIGFSGQEDLGNGVSAVFGIESWFGADTGATIGNGFWARRANVGLKSATYGTLLLGHNPTSLFVHSLVFAPYANSQGLAPTQRFLFSRYAATEGGTTWQNSVQYQTPVFNGFSGTVHAAMKESAAGKNSYAASLMYAKGPLAAGLAYQNWQIGTSDQSTVLLGTSYDLSVVKLYGQYGRVKDKANGDNEKYAQLGLKAPYGPGAFLASYGHTQTETPATDYITRTFTFGYDYSLSKRTELYATGMYDKLSYTYRGMTYLAGIRHNF
jgi:predicted porin